MSPQSLHYIDRSGQGRLNQYQQAIVGVGNVVEEYDTDKRFPVFGFGARVRLPNGQFTPVQHCFPVYGGGVEVFRVNGIMQVRFRHSSLLVNDFCYSFRLMLMPSTMWRSLAPPSSLH